VWVVLHGKIIACVHPCGVVVSPLVAIWWMAVLAVVLVLPYKRRVPAEKLPLQMLCF